MSRVKAADGYHILSWQRHLLDKVLGGLAAEKKAQPAYEILEDI